VPPKTSEARVETRLAETPRPAQDRRRPFRIRSPHDETPLEAVGDFVRRVYKKADQDQIFFMAGAIAFNVLVAIVPLILASLGIAGQILQKRLPDPEETLLRNILNAIPPVGPEFEEMVRRMLSDLLGKSSGITIVSLFLLMWVSTRLVGTLRAALREVFDIGVDRNIIQGKLFDLEMVLFTGTLFAINVTLTFLAQFFNDLIVRYGRDWFGLAPLGVIESLYLNGLAITSAWVMFLLIYRFLPYRRIHWRTAMVAATFTTTLFELLKRAFGWYVSHVADYGSTYGNIANLVILVLWVYYIAIVFILGGEVGQVAALRRIRRRQKERLG
jgi:membrane protein